MKKIKITQLFGVSMIPFLIGGCAELNIPLPFSSQSSYYKSIVKISLSDNSRRVIISDFLKMIKRYYPPAKTTFVVSPILSIQNRSFNAEFERKFRKAGYGLSQTARGTKLAWKVDRIGKSLIRTTFILDGVTISKIYHENNGNTFSYSAFSVKLGGRL